MENILRELNGRQFGDKYCFSRNGEKFEATLDYSGGVDYHWRDLIEVRHIDGKYRNVFKFAQGSYRDGEVKYWQNEPRGFVLVTDFSDIVSDITEWIDFITL